ncbi:MAG TPA: hypothetical protein VG714_07160 [Acidobacteriaceae bacterium]|nr:hypothetical protein [Acidobacteriaceae bacterium]
MIRANVTAHNSELAQDELPSAYNSYMVWADEFKGLPDRAAAAIYSFTDGKLIRRFNAGLNERDAFSQALAILRSLPENCGLQFTVLEG